MDNVITGTYSVSDAIMLYKTSKQMFSDTSMNIRKWASNSEHVTENVLEEDRAEGIKVLGLIWHK